ncbi:flagellar operon protein [Anoxybacillus salavatliensis]|uniref:TIGR02530 family flagellar biosynthesis protein n=1 Tax=Anoxybacillus gonensis TaxID=198467 RepID=UPI00214C76C5|nr:TIGR02530 family flagellar biosynthesis protein [Anoxybacillus gonensis]MCQ5363742.1 flagellar operon protein [Anoxybacillus gonensis]
MNRIQFFPHTPLIPSKKQTVVSTERQSFRDELTKAEQTLKISKHAQQRLQERNIHINDEQWEMIGQKIAEAKQKGVRDSLVITDEAALIVSAVNQTVITAMHREEAQTQLFTNINGAIII